MTMGAVTKKMHTRWDRCLEMTHQQTKRLFKKQTWDLLVIRLHRQDQSPEPFRSLYNDEASWTWGNVTLLDNPKVSSKLSIVRVQQAGITEDEHWNGPWFHPPPRCVRPDHPYPHMKTTLSLAILLSLSTFHPDTNAAGDASAIRQIDQLAPEGIYNKIWEPHLAKWSDTHLVSCYGLQLRGKMDMGDIVCSISRDSGKTWSPRSMVFDHRATSIKLQIQRKEIPCTFRADDAKNN